MPFLSKKTYMSQIWLYIWTLGYTPKNVNQGVLLVQCVKMKNQARVHCPMCIEANTMTLVFEKSKSFICESLGKETRDRLKSDSLIQGSGQNFKGFQHQTFQDNGPFFSERVTALRFGTCPGSLVPWETSS